MSSDGPIEDCISEMCKLILAYVAFGVVSTCVVDILSVPAKAVSDGLEKLGQMSINDILEKLGIS